MLLRAPGDHGAEKAIHAMPKPPSQRPSPDAPSEDGPAQVPFSGEDLPSIDDATLDAWLRAALTDVYSDVLKEPVPPHLLRILRMGGKD